jgi:hypothetical protein
MKAGRIVAAMALAAVALTACDSSGNVTLHGTFTSVAAPHWTLDPHPDCADWVTGGSQPWLVTVTVDNVNAGSADIQWTGNPQTLASGYLSCTGSWSVSVARARVGYSLSVPAYDPGSATTVPAAYSGQPIALPNS